MASQWIKNAAPTSYKDIFIRVLKNFVSGAASGATVASFTSVTGVQAMMFAGGTAVFGYIQNQALKWANTP